MVSKQWNSSWLTAASQVSARVRKNDYCLYSGLRGRKFEFLTPSRLLYKPVEHIVILSILLKKTLSLQVDCWVSIELLGNYSHSSLSWGVEVKYELWLLYCPSNSSSQTKSLLLLVTLVTLSLHADLTWEPHLIPCSALPVCRAALWPLHFYTTQCTAFHVFLKVHHRP